MSTIFIILTILALLASVLLTVVVLLQNGKGGGLESNFVTGNQTFGVRQTADILEKITWVLVVIIFLVTVIASFAARGPKSGNALNEQIEQAATGAPVYESGDAAVLTEEGVETPAE